MNIPEKIFKSYDIRGIYPADINEENIVAIIHAIYRLFTEKVQKNSFSVVLSRDMRLSSPTLHEIAKKTLVELGATVIDAGLISTPTFYFTVSYYGYDSGIQITASHNPKEYAGVKFVVNSPKGLIKIGKSTGMEDIKKYVKEGIRMTPRDGGSVTNKKNILKEEVKNSLEIFGNPKIKQFTIVADAANAMGGQYIDALFSTIPANLIRMNFKLDGSFPVHQPDPLQEKNLEDVKKRVMQEKADLGLAPDGDGDRLMFIDETGNLVPPSIITSLVARELLKNNPGETILYDIRYIQTPQKIIGENGGKSVMTKVGHAFITEKMHETGGIFAGESSGHYFFRATGNAEAQMPMIVCVLAVLTRENKKISEIANELKRSFESGEINFEVNNAQEIMDAIKERYKDGEISTMDGISVNFGEWRFVVRPSNTEPLLRLTLESYDKSTMEDKRAEMVSYIKSLAKS